VTTKSQLADDLLIGATAIAAYLGWTRDRVYNAARHKRLPIDYYGALYRTTKTKLDRALGVEAA
jgi:predicted TIM-barrel fold metal-dependent hydrolase